MTDIGERAFYNCTSLESVTIGSGVTGIGNDAFSGCSSLTGVYITDTEAWCKISFGNSAANPLYYAGNLYLDNKLVTGLTISTNLTSIGKYAFYYCKSLTSVTITSRVTSIGTEAFYGCEKLIEVHNLSSSLTLTKGETDNGYVAYYAQNVYTSSVGTTKLTTKDGYIFYDDTANGNGCYLVGYTGNETSLTLPDYCNDKNYSIYKYAFYGCTALESVTIGSGVTDIGDWAFSGCTSLTEITVPDGVTNIGERAFYGCTSLTSVTIGSGVTSIGTSAFYDCTALTSITIPDGVTSIGVCAFYGCTALESVTIGSGVTSIGIDAFGNCYKLIEVYNLSSLNITAGSSDNGYVAYYAQNVYTATEGESKLTTTDDGLIFYDDTANGNGYYLMGYKGNAASLTLPDKYNGENYSIYQYAFYKCTSLTSITIGSGVTSIGDYAFLGCSSLTGIVIPNSVTSIGNDAFQNCSSLESVTIGNGVTSIGSYAFYGCTSLNTVYYNGTADDWNKISIGSSNTYLTNATRYYYSESEPTTDGNYWHYDEDGVKPVIWA